MRSAIGYVHKTYGGSAIICSPCHRKQAHKRSDSCARVDEFDGFLYDCDMQHCDNTIGDKSTNESEE